MKTLLEVRAISFHKRGRRVIQMIALICMLWVPATAVSETVPYDYNYGLGPLNLAGTSPGQSLRLNLPHILPGAIRPGWGYQISASTSNVWLNESEYFFDYEILNFSAAVKYGINKRFGLGVYFDQRTFYGGILDGFIESFHDAFGLDQDGRDHWPKYQTWVILRDHNGNPLLYEDDVGDLLNNKGIGLAMQYTLMHGDRWIPAVGLSAIIHYGLDGPDSPEEPVDFGIGLGVSKRLSKAWYAFGSVGYTYYNQTRFDYLVKEFEKDAISAIAALAWHLRPAFPVMLQYQFQEGLVKDLGNISDASHELTLGFKWRLKQGGVIGFGLIENIIIYDNSSDFGIHLSYAYNFK